MAVLSADKAWPRAGSPVRKYEKGGPLFARQAMKFCGVEYVRGQELPVALMTDAKHYELWVCGKADHSLSGPFDRRPTASTVTADSDALTEAELEKLTAPAVVPMGAVLHPGGEKRTIIIDGKAVEMTAGPTISVATPEQQAKRSQRKR